jgi:hypothetical protein
MPVVPVGPVGTHQRRGHALPLFLPCGYFRVDRFVTGTFAG